MADNYVDEAGGERRPREIDRGAVFAALTGRKGDVSGGGESVRGMLAAVAGTSRRTGEVDTRAAAAALGVSQRTVQRWLRSERETGRAGIRPENLTRTQKSSRQAATTRQGRRRALQDARTRRNRQRPVTVQVHGEQGPRRTGKRYCGPRTTQASWTRTSTTRCWMPTRPAATAGVADYLETVWAEDFLDDWSFHQHR